MTSVVPGPAAPASSSEVQAQIHYRLVERLSASERRHRGLVEGLRDPVFQCEASGRLTFRNAAWHRMFGESESDPRGSVLTDYAHPEDVGILRRALAEVGDGDDGAVNGEFRGRVVESEELYLEFAMHRTPDGVIVGSLHNVTAQQQLQDSLRAAKAAAEEASRLKSSFLANMSHEIRTPLSAVLGFTDLLGQDDLSPGDREEFRQRVVRNGQQLLTLVNDILDFSKVESGHLAVSQEAFPPCQLVDDLAVTFAEQAEARGVELAVAWAGDPPSEPLLVSDPVRLRQVLSNLLSNAIKFTPRGKVVLEVQVDAGREIIDFTVRDTGVGIPEDKQDAVFEPFRQVDLTTTRRVGGTGLGLAISRRLAGLLQGELMLESEEGKGSAFTLTLPLRTAPAKAGGGLSDESIVTIEFEPHAASRRVLLVEDTLDLSRLMGRLIAQQGLEVVAAANGLEALSAVEEAEQAGLPFGLVLMDMQMPVMDGYQATEALRATGFQAPVVALTAHALRGDRERCLAAGCHDYLSKPVQKPQLRKVLERYCGRPADGPAEVAPEGE